MDEERIINTTFKLKDFTWGEFKTMMESKGIEDGDKIWYIDIDLDFADNDIYLYVDTNEIQCTNFPRM